MTTENLKNPSIKIAPDPAVGIDAALEPIRANLATLPWLQKAFGRAWTKPRVLGGKTVLEPLLFQGSGEYYPALPNDYLQSYSFFRVGSPRTMKNFEQNMNVGGQFMLTDPVDLIVWVDLKAINSAMDWIFTETLISDVLKKLNTSIGLKVTRIYDDKVDDIFQGYDLREIHQGLLLYPYKGFRISCDLTYEFQCIESVTPDPEPEPGNDGELDFQLDGPLA